MPQISKVKIDDKTWKKAWNYLIQVTKGGSDKDREIILKSLLTETEQVMVTKRLMAHLRPPANKYPPAKPEVLRLLAPQRCLTAIAKSKPKTEKSTNGRLPELSNFGSPPAEPGVYYD